MSASTSVSQDPGGGAAAFGEGLRNANGAVYQGWTTTIVSTIGLALGPSSLLVFCFGTFVIPLQREFNWGIGAITFGATLISLMIILGSVAGGYLVDRFGCCNMVLWSVPCFAAGMAGLSQLTPNILVFYAALIGVSLLAIGAWPVSYNKATASWFDKRLGLSLGIANAGIGIGAAILPALLAYVIALYGWRAAYVVLGVLAFVVWPLALLGLRERRAISNQDRLAHSHLESGLNFKQSTRCTEFWLMIAGFVVLGTASSSIVVHMVRILVDNGISPVQATAMQSVMGIALIFGRVCTGWILDRVRASTIMVVLCLASSGALALLAAGSPYGTAPLSAAVAGFLIGAEFDVLAFLIPRYFGRRAFGSIYGAIFAVFQLSSAVTIGVMGFSRDALGAYSVPLSIIAVLLLAGALVFAQLKAYRFGGPESRA